MSEVVTTTDLIAGSQVYVYLPFVASKPVSTDTFQWSNDLVNWATGTYVTSWPNPDGTTATGTAVRAFAILVGGKWPWYTQIADAPETPRIKHGYLQVPAS